MNGKVHLIKRVIPKIVKVYPKRGKEIFPEMGNSSALKKVNIIDTIIKDKKDNYNPH